MKTVEVKQIIKPLFNRSIQPKAILSELTPPYTPGFNSRTNRINTGLSLEEEAYFLPMIIPVPSTDNKFRDSVEEWYIGFSQHIPMSGLAIDASYDIDEKGNIKPHNIKDFLMSKMLENDITVISNTDDNTDKDDYIAKFELIDLTIQEKLENQKFEDGVKAQTEFLKLVKSSDNIEAVKQVLILVQGDIGKSVIDIHTMKALDANKLLDKFVKEQPDKFIKVMSTPNLRLLALAREAINMNIITKLGDNYYLEGTKSLAPSLKGIANLMKSENEIHLKIEALVKQYKEDYSRY